MGDPLFEYHPLEEGDLTLLIDWLDRPHVRQWWDAEDVSLEGVRREYLPRARGAGDAHPFLAYLDGQPVGYIQYYWAAEGDRDWWPDDPGPGVVGIDQFIGDPSRLNQGLGTAMIRQFTDILKQNPAVTEIRADPRPDNVRAIRCYEKVGFLRAGRITTPDGQAIMMVLTY
jgi:aminoglycoside 6'-N-acetyltransferase-1b/aminoglycoside 6'-N-acetyltransferase-2